MVGVGGLCSVGPWFVPSLSREVCDAAVAASLAGDFLVRENHRGDRYVLCVNPGLPAPRSPTPRSRGRRGPSLRTTPPRGAERTKNFQILVEGGKYKFLGNLHDTLGQGEATPCTPPLLFALFGSERRATQPRPARPVGSAVCESAHAVVDCVCCLHCGAAEGALPKRYIGWLCVLISCCVLPFRGALAHQLSTFLANIPFGKEAVRSS